MRSGKTGKEQTMLSAEIQNYEIKEAIGSWLIFLGQLALIILGCVLLYFIYRYLRTVKKRIRAVKNLKKSAERAGFKCKKVNGYLNFNKRNMKTCFMLSNGIEQYNVRFLATFGKNRNLRFYATNAYVLEKEWGYTLALGKRSMIATELARAFKPENVSEDFMKITHTEILTFPSDTIYTQGTEVLRSGNVHEILILNPVPLKAFYMDTNSWKEIIGGETWQNLSFHDISSFCSMIERKYG